MGILIDSAFLEIWSLAIPLLLIFSSLGPRGEHSLLYKESMQRSGRFQLEEQKFCCAVILMLIRGWLRKCEKAM